MQFQYTVHVPATATLDDINTHIIPDEEGDIGPLVHLALGASETLLTFVHDGTHPAVNAILSRNVDGKPDVPAAATVIEQGQIFLQGNATLCTAYRPASSA